VKLLKIIKKRKPRGVKLNGKQSYDMCPYCYMPHCDSFAVSSKYYLKIEKRLEQGLCPACGQIKCKCKSTILTPEQFQKRKEQLQIKRKNYLEKLKNKKEK
jgi:hypothetical protein